MKKLYIIFMLLLSLLVGSCEKENKNYEELSDDKAVPVLTLQKGINGQQKLKIFPQDGSRTTQIAVNYGGLGLPSSAIGIDLVVDNAALDSINKLRIAGGLVPYLKFPEGSYSLDKTTVTIPSGQVSSDFATLTYNTDSFDLKDQYLIVFRASNNSGYQFAAGTNKIEFLAAVVEEDMSKTEWKKEVSASATQASDAGGAAALFDSNTDTYWHTPYSGTIPPWPHEVRVDFGKDLYLTKILLQTRHNNGSAAPKDFDFQVSTDGVAYTTYKSFTNSNNVMNTVSTFDLADVVKARYVKLSFKNGFNASFMSLGEIGFRGYK